MELALNFKRFISLTAVVFLFAAITGCTEKPADKPVPKSGEKKVAVTTQPKENADVADSPSEKTSDIKGATTGIPPAQTVPLKDKNEESASEKDNGIREFLLPSNPGTAFENPDITPKAEAIETENQKPDAKEDKKAEEKPVPDTETKKPDTKEEGKVEEKPAADGENKKPEAKESEDAEKKPMTDEEIAASNAKQRETALKAIADKLGPPLVENVDKLKKMHPVFPVWIDKENKQVILEGAICQTNAPLEMFAVPSGTKEHEAIVAVPSEAYVVHAALLAVGAKPGKPVEFGPHQSDYKPATGTPIDITVKWKNDKGEIQTARAQEWIKNVKTGKDMQESWVFGGSGFWKDDQTGIEYYKAEGGDFICVSNFPSAMLDLPIESSQSNDELMFQANSERIPPRDTAVTVILIPKPAADSKQTGPEGTQSLMKMVDPKSVIQEEEEPKLGIGTESTDSKK